MKWKEDDFNKGIETIRAVLIYGPDAGQVDEFCDRAIEKLQIERDNMFALNCAKSKMRCLRKVAVRQCLAAASWC